MTGSAILGIVLQSWAGPVDYLLYIACLISSRSSLSIIDRRLIETVHSIEPAFVQLQKQLSDMTELKRISDDACEDEEIRQISRQDLSAVSAGVAQTVDEIVDVVLPEETYDAKDVTMEVQAGAGGLEAGLFAQEIFDMYVKYAAESEGLDVSVVEYDRLSVGQKSKFASNSGIKRAAAVVRGHGVFKRMKFECGVHRVQRVPVTGTKTDRMQTSTCSLGSRIDIKLASGQ